MNWRSNGQDHTTTFEELKIGMTFFFGDIPYLKTSKESAFNIDENFESFFEEDDTVEPCMHELILRR